MGVSGVRTFFFLIVRIFEGKMLPKMVKSIYLFIYFLFIYLFIYLFYLFIYLFIFFLGGGCQRILVEKVGPLARAQPPPSWSILDLPLGYAYPQPLAYRSGEGGGAWRAFALPPKSSHAYKIFPEYML